MDKAKTLFDKYLKLIKGKTKEVREDGNALIFLVFLFLAACFWVLNALQKDDYTTEVKFPVKFVNVQDDEIVSGSLKRDLTLKIKGGGFKILPYHLSQRFSAEAIDITNLRRIKVNDVNGAYLNSKEYFKLIEGKLAVGLELVNISPDTLFVPVKQKKSKMLPVRVNASVTYEEQCQLSGPISILPDSVMVSGAEEVLDSLDAIYTKALVYENLSDTITRNVLLDKGEQIELKTKRVVVTIPVEPFTEASISVPIEAINLPDDIELKSFPSAVNISYHIGLSRPLFSTLDFKASIDFSNIDLNNLPRRLKVKINDSPSEVHNMTYQPMFVEYLLERKEHN
ncbi:CdaR family protein [Carboxylicivirga marina]|uniref:YbbR-like domain-containing protein n=1 Tax=Carboxylicivirga marina TaxID=2800988 RepID=A0ABS1HNT0_9BACT|nr:CdaR family protein [Carboxylicivirga marina]MBK3519354.1 YbbR-like domain-containing protein [Carboxylicivirga marina]